MCAHACVRMCDLFLQATHWPSEGPIDSMSWKRKIENRFRVVHWITGHLIWWGTNCLGQLADKHWINYLTYSSMHAFLLTTKSMWPSLGFLTMLSFSYTHFLYGKNFSSKIKCGQISTTKSKLLQDNGKALYYQQVVDDRSCDMAQTEASFYMITSWTYSPPPPGHVSRYNTGCVSKNLMLYKNTHWTKLIFEKWSSLLILQWQLSLYKHKVKNWNVLKLTIFSFKSIF